MYYNILMYSTGYLKILSETRLCYVIRRLLRASLIKLEIYRNIYSHEASQMKELKGDRGKQFNLVL